MMCKIFLAVIFSLLTALHSIADEKPHVVVVVGTQHYSPHLSMPDFTKELEQYGFRTTLVMGKGDPEKKIKQVLPGIKALAEADVAIFYMRFLQLPGDEWKHVENYIRSGKPVIGLRTSNHAFKYPNDHPRFHWNDGFGRRVLGTPYVAHQESKTKVSVVGKYNSHPVLSNIAKKNWVSSGKLYLSRLEPGCVPLLIGSGTAKTKLLEKSFGTVVRNESEADVVAWTWENEWGAKVFATSFGHVDDFAEESFTRMLVNSVCWAADRPMVSAEKSIKTWKIDLGQAAHSKKH